MMFWIGILIGGTFAWFAIKLRFYQTWTLAFNIIISIYLSLYLRPVIVNIPAVGDTPYSNALAMAAIALASFLILHGISYTFFTGQFNVSFPKIFDAVVTGLLGFLAGFLVWSFLCLLIYITPVSQNTFVKDIGFTDQFQQTSILYLSRFCNLVNAVVSSQDNEQSAEQTINKLLKGPEPKKARGKTPEKPTGPAEPNNAKTGTTKQKQVCPPPEPNKDT